MSKARTQEEHKRINATEYPGTRQMCIDCDDLTGRCEEDAIYTNLEYGPLCEECWDKYRGLDEKAKRLDEVIKECQRLIEASEDDFSFGASMAKGVAQRILKAAKGGE